MNLAAKEIMHQKKISVLHIMDKFSVGGSSIHGALQILFYVLPAMDPERFVARIVGLRREPMVSLPEGARGIVVSSLNLGKFNVFSIFTLIRIILREKPDIVHLHGYASWNFGRIAALFTRTPVVLQEHMAPSGSPLYQRIADWILRALPARGIAVSGNVKEFMEKTRYVKSKDIVVIPNGIPLRRFSEFGSVEIGNLKTDLDIGEDSIVVGTVGRLDPVKGYSYLLEALPGALKKFPNLVLVMVGDGPLQAELKKSAEDLKISASIRFLGHRDDVPELLNIFDVFVMTSLAEGFGLAAVEAMASGRPIIASDCEGLKNLFHRPESALFFRSENSADLELKLIQLLSEKDLKLRLSMNAKTLSREYDIQSTARMYAGLYAEVLEKE